ncbi:helix-turn-helix domain-containing protein [Kibdelosporangium philippinense]|uniref:helix-turn-helix domain-containing protein n=1 Tax=Kibdelosporangium philippinense TaxID=211113 RepID=UPI00361CF30D
MSDEIKDIDTALRPSMRLRKLLVASGKTQAAVAREANCVASTLADALSGRRIPADTLADQILIALGEQPDDKWHTMLAEARAAKRSTSDSASPGSASTPQEPDPAPPALTSPASPQPATPPSPTPALASSEPAPVPATPALPTPPAPSHGDRWRKLIGRAAVVIAILVAVVVIIKPFSGSETPAEGQSTPTTNSVPPPSSASTPTPPSSTASPKPTQPKPTTQPTKTTLPTQSSTPPPSKTCKPRELYDVLEKGEIQDANGKVLGTASRGDQFLRLDTPPDRPASMQDRHYGVVYDTTGYFLIKKLKYAGTTELFSDCG